MLIVKIQNITNLSPVSDYRYEVLVNLEVIAGGEVKGHVRAEGWAELVRRVIEPHLVKPTMLQRFDEMVYALDAGNLDREDIPAVVLHRWIEYVQAQ
jgi:hypothetical protein